MMSGIALRDAHHFKCEINAIVSKQNSELFELDEIFLLIFSGMTFFHADSSYLLNSKDSKRTGFLGDKQCNGCTLLYVEFVIQW